MCNTVYIWCKTPLNVTSFSFTYWLSHIHNDSDMAFLFSEDWLSFLVTVTQMPEALLHVGIAAYFLALKWVQTPL